MKMNRFISYSYITLLVLIIIYGTSISIRAKTYRPELSGDYEIGERTYTDLYELNNGEDETETEEDVIDYYLYRKMWLKYRQKLNTSDYYYFKVQYNRKDYQEKESYNSISLDLWTNYSFKINDRLKNKFMFDFRNKEYIVNAENTYNQIRLKYQLDCKIDEKNDCSIYVQRQWKDFLINNNKDNIYDRLSLSWDWDVNDNLTVNSNIQLDNTSFKPISDSTNKEGRKFNVGFKWKM